MVTGLGSASLAAAVAIEIAAGFVQGSLGFGINTLAVPLLSLISLRFLPGPVIIASVAIAAVVAWRERGGIQLKSVGWAIAGRIPGNFLGILVLTALTASTAGVTVAILVLAAVLGSITRRRLPRTAPALFLTGTVSGVMGTVAGLGGIPLGLVHQDLPGRLLRPTMSAFVIIGGLLSLATLAASGRLGSGQIVPTLILLPGAALGYLLSGITRDLVDARIRPILLAVAALASVTLIIITLLR